MRAKVRLESVLKTEYSEKLTFVAVGRSGYPTSGVDENNTYSLWTPQAHLELTVNNPNLHGKFKPGQQFYVDFTETESLD